MSHQHPNFYKSDLLKRLSLKKMQRMNHQHPIRLKLGKGGRGGSRPDNFYKSQLLQVPTSTSPTCSKDSF